MESAQNGNNETKIGESQVRNDMPANGGGSGEGGSGNGGGAETNKENSPTLSTLSLESGGSESTNGGGYISSGGNYHGVSGMLEMS